MIKKLALWGLAVLILLIFADIAPVLILDTYHHINELRAAVSHGDLPAVVKPSASGFLAGRPCPEGYWFEEAGNGSCVLADPTRLPTVTELLGPRP
jgi:hypothetical protein